MNEQAKRFAGLRRICQAQEGRRSPCYQVHDLYFDPQIAHTGVMEKREIEVEATDLIWPYHTTDFMDTVSSAPPRFSGASLGFFLNESSEDILTLDQFYVPKIINFPFYKINIEMLAWEHPETWDEFMHLQFYTFTDPRVIQALENL